MEIKGLSLSDQLRMMRNVPSIQPIDKPGLDQDRSPKPGQVSFGEVLAKQFETANTSGVNAEKAIQQALMGETSNPHSTVIAVQKASVSLTLMMSIKERLERAYQDIIRMQIG